MLRCALQYEIVEYACMIKIKVIVDTCAILKCAFFSYRRIMCESVPVLSSC